MQTRPAAPHREWFADERTPVRRMQVSWHPEKGLVVLSLWQNEACTATFRLPIADSPRLVHLLVGALGDVAASSRGAAGEADVVPWLARLKRRLRPALADVVQLVDDDDGDDDRQR